MTNGRLGSALVTIAVAGACGGAAKPVPATPSGTGDAMAQHPAHGGDGVVALDAMEARLLAEDAIEITFDIEAKGRFVANVKGEVQIARDNRVRWRVSGTFDGKPISVDRTFTASDGAKLSEAVVIGWTRMGLLHNIALLARAQGIEHAAGGMAGWITTTTTAADDSSVTIDLIVAGQPMGTARIDVDQLGLPTARAQTVKFPDGDMIVEENYAAGVPDAFPSDVFAAP